jgi:hypothetical protein
MMSNILIVDDEKAIADLLEVYLQNENYNVIKYYSSTGGGGGGGWLY